MSGTQQKLGNKTFCLVLDRKHTHTHTHYVYVTLYMVPRSHHPTR